MELLLVGGGHAMLPALQRAPAWKAQGVQVTLLNDHPVLYYSGMTPEHLGGVYTTEEASVDLQAFCARHGVRFVHGQAVRLDLPSKTVYTASGTAFAYDLVAFDVGGHNPAQPDGAIATKPLHHIEALNQRVQDVLTDPQGRLRLVVAGGGAAGVEIALNLTARFAGADRAGALDLLIAEPAPRMLPGFPTGMSRHVADQLQARGVTLCTGAQVTMQDGRALLNDQTPLNADAVLWATGTVGQPFFREAGLPCDEQGFLCVEPTLQCEAHPWLFAAGDCAVVQGLEKLARIGVHAVRQGPVLRDNLDLAITAYLKGQLPTSLAAFQPYPIAPLILSTGRREGLWTAGRLWLRGELFLRLKHYVDRRWIRRYQTRGWAEASFWDLLDAACASR